jgi:hypothetical protein
MSSSRWGANATPSTQSIAPGIVWTVSAIARTSVIVPRMLLVCVHVTSAVCSESSGFSDSGVKCGLRDLSVGDQNLRVILRVLARKTQEAMLASWSTVLQISSALGPRDWR